MQLYGRYFAVLVNSDLPTAILQPAYEIPKYDKYKIHGRPVIMADNVDKLPALFEQAVIAGIIDADDYDAMKTYYKKTHGIII